jgi:hypothetical protein
MKLYSATKIVVVVVALWVCSFVVPRSLAQSGSALVPDDDHASYVVFDAPNGMSMYILGINDRGEVTGDLVDIAGNSHGFVRDAQGTFTVFDAPNAITTSISNINNHGEITGQLTDTGGNFRGFVRDRQGNFTVFDASNSDNTGPTSINNKGEIVGQFGDVVQHRTRGFIRDMEGNFTTFDADPNAHDTTPYAINELGDVAGVFIATDQWQSFVRDSQGVLVVFDTSAISEAPNLYLGTFALSMNNEGEVTGNVRIALHRFRGFVRDRQGDLVVFDAPNSAPDSVESIPGTLPVRINDAGQIVGYFSDAIQRTARGFVRDRQGNFTIFDAPNSGGTVATSINNRGEIAGTFSDVTQGGKTRGFLRFPDVQDGNDGENPDLR